MSTLAATLLSDSFPTLSTSIVSLALALVSGSSLELSESAGHSVNFLLVDEPAQFLVTEPVVQKAASWPAVGDAFCQDVGAATARVLPV